MDYEANLNQALDLLADAENEKAARLLQGCVDHIKRHLTGDRDDLDRYYYWGRCLTAMEEYEQALLKFEQALRLDSEHEASLWETVSIFLHDLDRPESAKTLLEARLLPLRPGHAAYEEALKTAVFCIKLRAPAPEAPDPGAESDL